MSGLPLIGTTRLDSVIRPGRDIDHFSLIAIKISDKNAEGAVRIPEPTFKRRCHALSGPVDGLSIEMLAISAGACGECRNREQQRSSSLPLHPDCDLRNNTLLRVA